MAYRLPSLAIQHRTLRRLNGELPPMGLTTTYIQHLDKGGAFYWNVQIRYRFVRGNHYIILFHGVLISCHSRIEHWPDFGKNRLKTL